MSAEVLDNVKVSSVFLIESGIAAKTKPLFGPPNQPDLKHIFFIEIINLASYARTFYKL
jgi:hypothetical protein